MFDSTAVSSEFGRTGHVCQVPYEALCGALGQGRGEVGPERDVLAARDVDSAFEPHELLPAVLCRQRDLRDPHLVGEAVEDIHDYLGVPALVEERGGAFEVVPEIALLGGHVVGREYAGGEQHADYDDEREDYPSVGHQVFDRRLTAAGGKSGSSVEFSAFSHGEPFPEYLLNSFPSL